MIAGAVSVFWIRLDRPGNDACRFAETGEALLVEGSATDAEGHAVHYRCRARLSDGVSIRARVGETPMMTFERDDDGAWAMNGTEVPAVHDCADIDLGITPATNTFAIRRLKLAVGARGESRCAWLDPVDWVLKPLDQVYERVSETEYDFSTSTGFATRLVTDDHGIVRTYPGLWQARS